MYKFLDFKLDEDYIAMIIKIIIMFLMLYYYLIYFYL